MLLKRRAHGPINLAPLRFSQLKEVLRLPSPFATTVKLRITLDAGVGIPLSKEPRPARRLRSRELAAKLLEAAAPTAVQGPNHSPIDVHHPGFSTLRVAARCRQSPSADALPAAHTTGFTELERTLLVHEPLIAEILGCTRSMFQSRHSVEVPRPPYLPITTFAISLPELFLF